MEKSLLQPAGRFPQWRKVSCSLQEGFRNGEKSPAACRKVSATEKSLLQPAGRFPQWRKVSCSLQEGLRNGEKSAESFRSISAVCRKLPDKFFYCFQGLPGF